ncbi:MAG: GGDEF domain-containing protein [Lachnospiraceae bacterium]|nr:GGDEF domain-containing protein [Lachnospiraceae bacterium]
MQKRKHSVNGLANKFIALFTIFTIITLIASGAATYINQNNVYKEQCREELHKISAILKNVLEDDGKEFINIQNYIIEYPEKIMIKRNFTEWQPEELKYKKLLQKYHPGKVYGLDLTFDELDDKVKTAYVTYKLEYYFLTFEKTKTASNLIYTYYTTKAPGDRNMYYIIDAIRDVSTFHGEDYLNMRLIVNEPIDEHRAMWETSDTGIASSSYDTYDNEFGKTYAYYSPVTIDNKCVGIIGADIEIANVNKEILKNTLQQMANICAVIVIAIIIAVIYVKNKYIDTLEKITKDIEDYTYTKDTVYAQKISNHANNNDEIGLLAGQTASMIYEIDEYAKNLMKVTNELDSSKEKEKVMRELVLKDALTGVRNKAAYDNEVARLEWQLKDGKTKFGICVVDLNYLKRINDTYGHEKGNIAIKNICHIICEIFAHSPVFRIGGDEFAIILENDDFENKYKLIEEFKSRASINKPEDSSKYVCPWQSVSASIGLAVYNPQMDTGVQNVFRRADKAMYEHKKEMKSARD